MKFVIKLIGLTDGSGPTPFDDQYVADYAPSVQGVNPNGQSMNWHLRTTPNVEDARQFSNGFDCLNFYHQSSRHDSRFRPLTVYAMKLEKVGTKEGPGDEIEAVDVTHIVSNHAHDEQDGYVVILKFNGQAFAFTEAAVQRLMQHLGVQSGKIADRILSGVPDDPCPDQSFLN